jgi:hypothetical protein
VTTSTYLHVTDAMHRSHADRIDAVLGEAVNESNVPTAVGSVPQRCHEAANIRKKPRDYKVFMVAPTGFEPVNGDPGRSRRLPRSPVL